MRRLVVGLLALFRRMSLLILKLRGKTAADVAEQRVVSGRAHDGNWLPMTAESRTLMGLQTFLDRAAEETAGHTSGTMCFRWIKAEEHLQPQTRVVRSSELEALRKTPNR